MIWFSFEFRQVSTEEGGENKAKEFEMVFFEVSSNSGVNVPQVFKTLTTQLLGMENSNQSIIKNKKKFNQGKEDLSIKEAIEQKNKEISLENQELANKNKEIEDLKEKYEKVMQILKEKEEEIDKKNKEKNDILTKSKEEKEQLIEIFKQEKNDILAKNQKEKDELISQLLNKI